MEKVIKINNILKKLNEKDDVREKLSDYAHKSWSGWMEYLFSKSDENEDGSVTISKDLVYRWKRQVETDYEDLSEEEKDSDRDEADKMLKILNNKSEE